MKETIVAQATAPGRGGIGILRVSGPLATKVAQAILGKCPKPRMADYLPFKDADGTILDQGIALYFKSPNSFTGEDVLELQGHGGQVVLDLLLKRILQIDGIRLARPGEFSEQAFLNDKLDLAQAEAIADLIDATSEQAVRSALKSLQGEFSKKVNELVDSVIYLRTYVEASIDFPDEEIDFLADGKIEANLRGIINQLEAVRSEAKQGSILREGMKVVIAGRPNAGKSSLLNALAGHEAAIVTDIAGTTRDVLREHIHIDGMPLHIIDTAGLRDATDEVERIGISRAWTEIEQADRIILMLDSSDPESADLSKVRSEFLAKLPSTLPVTLVRNKIDLNGEQASESEQGGYQMISLSAQTHDGVQLLREHLKQAMGFQTGMEGGFLARRRHLDALDKAAEHLQIGLVQLTEFHAGELLAEELRLVQSYLSEITGQFTSDDLLGNIFSSFCIGK
ncbi:TPA: tRNA uridine-5-carboxymethylaminomethyl(34) synthesis GTPase MnmE [Haemophilus influenzae]|uniref:tRNA uridine-5-carboxymethylaminomethyl(34) synthesis GTPase MnmE n=1 Tax=Haemophilus influenzae TaxID=727 RepID=UPI0006656D0B|nr:tRNA uridine-5-carboxymethylaminomethyl(34) synthesis GTPase MnmE [Haemophilus influenzae]AXP38707.1 tRNA uridine-5-carboxymethylaminomethyl(34) synthesis GTPase MnmE [Haemophilus influenzae]AXP67252.1 tRNA uridine-5-carboxymethylaminomethyl(34) synthesis GTPase MnmE [Haemophilus influenzae]AYO35325.1 tRNA uridine-5-carboxymethylaminomethyl(34) synthesis GTPase MnmE [Haemophilus influenzae]MCK9648688.1 tRNA uridine-5-carboxymethylaminomethyl(34) synthesis GTPase MnmE [Haemophilus influenzae]